MNWILIRLNSIGLWNQSGENTVNNGCIPHFFGEIQPDCKQLVLFLFVPKSCLSKEKLCRGMRTRIFNFHIFSMINGWRILQADPIASQDRSAEYVSNKLTVSAGIQAVVIAEWMAEKSSVRQLNNFFFLWVPQW